MIIDNKLAEVFDVEIVEQSTIIKQDGSVLPPETNNDEEYDFRQVRDNLYTLLRHGQEGLDFALQIAKDSENPRAVEVFSGLLKTLVETNSALVDMHEKRKKNKKAPEKPVETGGTNIQTNNVYVGTSKDLKKFINDLKNAKE